MPFCNKFLAIFAVLVLLSAPAFADGTPGKPVNRGPEPVQAHQPVPPEPGCYLIEDGRAWSCPAHPATKIKPAPVIEKQSASTPCCGTFKRTIVKEHPPVVTKRTTTHRKAPTQRIVKHYPAETVRTVQTSNEVRLDMASFTGGVGSGVDGGFYGGGGGAIVISSGRSFSGVLSHSASQFTFRGHRGGKKRGGGGGRPCGC
ncbi:MAG: hypothetical protein AAFP81_06535 [Pseudomonadota bacterium]